MRASRITVGVRAGLAAAIMVLSACAGDSEGAVVATRSTTPTPAGRPVGTAVEGRLRTMIPPVADENRTVLLYGDSVAVLVADDLAARLRHGIRVDAVDCRRLDRGFDGPCGGVPAGTHVRSGVEGLDDALAVQPPPDVAVVVIANNAALTARDLDAAMDALAAVPRVWWVGTDVAGRGWRDPNNTLLAELAERDDRAGFVDWFAEADGRDLRADHVHPTPAGQLALGTLIARHIECDCRP